MGTETKVIIVGIFLTIVGVVGVSFFLTKDAGTNVADSEIVAKTGIHWHPKLSISINGKNQELSNGIGLTGSVHQKIHTHDEDYKDGVVHMEMSGVVSKDDTKLGNFFRIWGKEFNSTQIFDKKNGPQRTVKIIVNGKQNTDFENYLMKDKDQIEIKYE